MKKILLFLLSGIMVICCAVAFISCKTTEETYTVSFYAYEYEDPIATVQCKPGEQIVIPQEVLEYVPESGDKLVWESQIMPDYDISIIAKAKKLCTLEVFVDGELYNTLTGYEGDSVELDDPPEKFGYRFEWYTSVPSVSAFENCVNLTTVTLPVGMSQLTEIKSRAFFDCTALTEVQIPSSVVSLGDYVFRGCSSLQTVVFGAESRLTAIPDYAFNRCTSLTQIELPFGVTSIGRFAFYGDSLLEEVTFVGNEGANALTTIGASAFEDCNRLASFVLSESMGTIGTDAFRGCSSLAIVYNYSSITLIKGSSSYGYIAFYATEILVKEIAV